VTAPFAIAAESPLRDEVSALVAALNDEMFALTPREHCHHMTVAEMAQPDTTVFIGRANGSAVACGALRRHAGRIGEVKRMYAKPEWRGRGVGKAILARIIAQAREERLVRMVLETGDKLHAARRIYEAAGFRRCDAVLDYPPSPFTVFYEMALIAPQTTRGELRSAPPPYGDS
jgi:putative acetyltransferase